MRRCVLAGSMLALVLLTTAPAEPPADRSEEWVRQRVRQIRASDTDAWRRIPWTATLVAAAQAARKEDRPIFVFSHDGNIDSGRC
jgi:hypothetical protein